jgi:predicted DCC family thiol-disulfide oxidoreductase YuxK
MVSRSSDGVTDATAAGGDRTAGVLTVLYDAECRFCTRIAARLAGADRARRLRIVPLQLAPGASDPAVRALAAGQDLRRSLHVIDASGEWQHGGAAMLLAWDRIPAFTRLARIARLPFVGWAVEPMYDWVARHRGRFAWLAGSTGSAKGICGAESRGAHRRVEASDGPDGERRHHAANDSHRRDDRSPALR